MTKDRYSNYDPTLIGPPSIDDVNPTLPGGSSYTDPSGSSGSWFDWNSFNQSLGTVSNLISNLFSPSWKWQNQTNSQLYQQEKRTNTILWVVIGLILALGVVLLIRKR